MCIRDRYGYIEIDDPVLWARSADTPINRKWWDFMADIMETNPDNSPVSVDLKPVQHCCERIHNLCPKTAKAGKGSPFPAFFFCV